VTTSTVIKKKLVTSKVGDIYYEKIRGGDRYISLSFNNKQDDEREREEESVHERRGYSFHWGRYKISGEYTRRFFEFYFLG